MYQPVPFDGMTLYMFSMIFLGSFAFAFIYAGRKEKQRNSVKWGIRLAVIASIVGFVGIAPAIENAEKRETIMEDNVKTKYNNKYGDTYLREVVYNHPSGRGSSGDYLDLTFEDNVTEEVNFLFDKTGEPRCYCELRKNENPTYK